MLSVPTEINQQALADALNVSRSTVSRSFTNHPGIKPETRAKVFELASKWGYHHMQNRMSNATQRNSEKSGNFAIIICSNVGEFNRGDYDSPGRLLLKGVSEYTQLENISQSVHFVSPSATSIRDRAYQSILKRLSGDLSGLLLMYPFPKKIVDMLNVQYSCVSLVEQRGAGAVNCVDVDHYQGIALIINELIKLGHKRIGFYTKHYEVEASWSLRRCGAYFEKMTQLGLPIHEKDMINISPQAIGSIEDSYDMAAKQIKDGVTAFVCAADHQAYDLIDALNKRGIRVPEDVSVTGFDGIQPPAKKVPLSTIKIPYNEIGFQAAKRLNDLVHKKYGPSQHILMGCTRLEGRTLDYPSHLKTASVI